MDTPSHVSAARSRDSAGVNLRWVFLLLMFIAMFSGFQGGRYYLANRLQELGIASAMILFAAGAWRGFFRLGYDEWRRWVVLPVVLVGGIILISSLTFILNYEGSLLNSVFSAREFMLAFVGPGIYLLCRCGLSLNDVRISLWVALVALMINYLLFLFTLDLRETFFSADHTISNLVTYDEWRGFRLKPPLFAIMVGLLGACMLLLQSRRTWPTIGALLVAALACYIWSVVQFRSTLATMLLAMGLYPVLLSHRSRLHLVLVVAPLALIAMPLLSMAALEHFLQADGGNIRARAFALAFQHMPAHPLFGAGEDSVYGQTYQDIVAPYFYPSDLGIVGTCFKYGLVGTCLYLFMHGKIWLNLWRANIVSRESNGRHDALLWALLMFMTAQTFNLVLNPGLSYAQGITLGSLAMALASVTLQKI